MTNEPYDPRYLAGVLLFNEQDYFGAHEVWEDVWADSHGPERRFFQGLIQAAVGLCHFGNGNLNGAVKLYRSSYDYMKACPSPFQGLDVHKFWYDMEAAYQGLLQSPPVDRSLRPDPDRMPTINLEPPPRQWPDPEAFLPHEDE